LFREFITPPVSVIKSIPVASFVIMVIIWAGASSLATVISALVVFPMIYHNVLSGLDATPSSMTEMSRLFRFRFIDKARFVFFPSVLSHLQSAILISSGMAFKSGIAAEVIGRPLRSVGSGLYLSKISLATSDLFAWTFCAVILAYLFEKAMSLILRRISSK
jgi:NitT/TauT family transport system permease protein